MVTRLRGAESGSQESVLNADERNILAKLGAKIDKSTTSILYKDQKASIKLYTQC